MKTISTLILFLVLSALSAFSQINQGFEGVSSLSQLSSNCWRFTGVGLSTQSEISGQNSLVFSATPNGSKVSLAIPYVNLTTNSSIRFAIKLSSNLAGNASRTLTVSLADINGNTTPVYSTVLNRHTPTTVLQIAATSPVTGVKRILVELDGNADGNSSLYFDDLRIDGSYNYNSPYGCNSNSAVLPVEIKNFVAKIVNSKAVLNWTVLQNEEIRTIEVEKTFDGRNFQKSTTIYATPAPGEETYTYQEVIGSAIQYRLKIVSKNGRVVYSQIIALALQDKGANVVLLQNPVRNSLRFSFNAGISDKTEIVIYNLLGSKVYSQTYTAQRGENYQAIELGSSLLTGAYLLEIKTAGKSQVVKFIKN